MSGACTACSKPLGDDAVHLWDGKDYCLECVEQACPGLSEYAKSHEVLEESMPYDKSKERLASPWFIIIASIVALPLAYAQALSEQDGDIFTRIAGVGLTENVCCLFMALGLVIMVSIMRTVLSPRSTFLISLRSPTISAANGRVTLIRGAARKRRLIRPCLVPKNFPLADCDWCFAKPKHDSALRGPLWLPRQPVVLLVCPGQRKTRPWSFIADYFAHRAACGWTPEMMRIWVGFLRLARVPEQRSRVKLPDGMADDLIEALGLKQSARQYVDWRSKYLFRR